MFDWNHYYLLSKEFNKIASSDPLAEAYYRSSISRCYYSVYHQVKAFAVENGFIEDSSRIGDRHAEIIDFLNEIDRSWAGNHLSKLKKNRHTCDYKNNVTVDSRLVNTSMIFASNIIGNLST